MPKKVYGTGIDLRGTKVINSGDGSSPTDLVTLQQMQAAMAGASWKPSVRLASTGNVNVSSAPASIDGVNLTANDRVLLKDQTDGTTNGIYVYSATGSPLTRATDNDTASEMKSATVLVEKGSANADKAFTQTADDVTLGTTTLTWVSFGGGATFVAGNGINISGSTISVKVGNGLLVDANGVRIDPSVVARKFSQSIGNGSATVIDVAHGLGTTDVTYLLRVSSTGEVVDTDVTVLDSNTLRLSFASAPANAELRLVVQG